MEKTCNEANKIFILAPAGIVTGGVELLHQLCNVLRNNKKEAYIVYSGDASHEIPMDYKKYNIQLADNIEDDNNNILILPEVSFDKFCEVEHIRVIVWWLSVDNYFLHFYGSFFDNYRYNPIYAFKRLLRENFNRIFLRQKYQKYSIKKIKQCRNIILHAYQSEYANHFLMKNGILNTVHLGDYINDDYIFDDYLINKKTNSIIYNPKKGINFTKKLIKASPALNWIPIENMTRAQVKETMRAAKLYVDFGYHPGKDRMPREAAMCGCCIITGKLGAAGFKEDLAIDETKYKFNQKNSDIPKIIQTIHYTLDNYNSVVSDFTGYREKISREKNEFEQDTLKILKLEKLYGGGKCRVISFYTAPSTLCA